MSEIKLRVEDAKRMLSPILEVVREFRSLVFFIVVTGILCAVFEGVTLGLIMPLLEGVHPVSTAELPFPFGRILDVFKDHTIASRLRWISGLLVFFTLLKSYSFFLNNNLTIKFQNLITKKFRMKIFEQVMDVGVAYLDDQKKGHLQTMAVDFTSSIGIMIGGIGKYISKFCIMLVCVALLISLSWKLTLFAFLIMGAGAMLIGMLQKISASTARLYYTKIMELNNLFLEALHGVRVVRLFDREKSSTKRFENEVDMVNGTSYKLLMLRGSLKPALEFYGAISLALILAVSSFVLVKEGEAGDLSLIFMFIIIFYRMMSPINEFNYVKNITATNMPAYRRVIDFLDRKNKPYVIGGERVFTGSFNRICFNNVTFNYEGRGSALHNVSFDIRAGKRLGIVGVSGCGKTTILNLLLRFYDPCSGDISIDGLNLKEFDVRIWRRAIGVVDQDVFLFQDTVRNNILFARGTASEEELVSACKKAHINDFILSLPKGFDTIVGDRGVLLSGGQRQRIAIARAILVNPHILIFDEATSDLDAESERAIKSALEEFGKEKTIISVAHRLSFLRDFDDIIVLGKGGILERGTPEELLRNNGLYTKLAKI
ncbi:MAG: ABC transporter ATP-binding protein [Candidatus Omnitrophica bacterium]|nr:ABC transporter ATP-binding protein [Candidatus Omnitrophota bacterium]